MDPQILREAMTAYEAVYNEDLRVELEEQQAFENWVNSLVEEGYDLSEYTWEEMYEAYLSEIPTSTQMGGKPAPAAKPQAPVMTAFSAGGGKAKVQKLMKTGMSGVEANRRVSATGEYLQKQAAKPQPQLKGLSIGKGGFQINAKPTAKPPATPAAKPAATTPAARPAARPAATTPAAKPPAAKPAPTATPKPVTQPPESKSQASAGEIRGMIGRSMERQAASAPAAKPTPTSPARPMGSRKPGSIVSGFDLFDVVKGHLLDEGYADTEEAALAIMANMSEEWRESIVSEAVKGESPERRKALAAERKSGVKPLSAKEGEKYASHKLSQMAHSKRRRMGDDD